MLDRIIDHKRKESIIDGEVYLETSKFVQAPFVENYMFATYKGNERQAFIDQLDLTTDHGEMRERTMTRYDQTILNAEIATIEELYDAAQHERAIIE